NWFFARMAVQWRASLSTADPSCWKSVSPRLRRKRLVQKLPPWSRGSPESKPRFYKIREDRFSLRKTNLFGIKEGKARTSTRDIFVCPLRKTFGRFRPEAKKIEIDKALNLEHYTCNKTSPQTSMSSLTYAQFDDPTALSAQTTGSEAFLTSSRVL